MSRISVTGKCGVVALAFFVFSAQGWTQDAARLGDFTDRADVGDPKLKGSVAYDPDAQAYTISGAGENMWFGEDEFHFVYRKMTGNFIVQTRFKIHGEGVNAHRKVGWMVRRSLDTDSPQANAVVHGDGLTSLQFRRTVGGETEQVVSALTSADVIQLERHGNDFIMSVARHGETFTVSRLDGLDLGDEVYVGLFVCSHEVDVVETATFDNVRITVPAADDFRPYRDYIGARIETLDVDSGARQVLYTSDGNMEAPNWTQDGKLMIYNSGGRLYRFPLDTKTPELMDTGIATSCNNDHVLSFDGTMLGISSRIGDDQSVILTMPLAGGELKRITPLAPSYLHGWSPDGKYLVYTGGRDGAWDIYRIPADGSGGEEKLTEHAALDDGPEYSPDGAYIYFNSSRTGTMQLWRMKADGSEEEQLTHDEFNDWFPHISPDGKRMVFISFPPEVDADDHPYYKRVYLRSMPVGGGEPKVVAYVYGGQGTINVPSWSADNRHVAFVSHTGGL